MDNYHVRQYDIEYESTRRFLNFLDSVFEDFKIDTPKSIIDLGCGAGANTGRLARHFPKSEICGLDIDLELVLLARKMNSGNLSNLKFATGDLFNFDFTKFEGVTAIQTISWVPASDMYKPFQSVLENQPSWFAFSCLGFEGKAHARIDIEDFSSENPWSTPYNVLSNVLLRELAQSLGYKENRIIQYAPINPITSESEGMGSRTRVLDSNQLAIFSGPLHLPWYFYFFKRQP